MWVLMARQASGAALTGRGGPGSPSGRTVVVPANEPPMAPPLHQVRLPGETTPGTRAFRW